MADSCMADSCMADSCMADSCMADSCMADSCMADSCMADSCMADSCMGKYSLVPRPLPDFISQPWRNPIFLHGCEIKSGSGLGTRLG